ncbi:MAG: GAF domain-containing protein [Anaerolineales bacterium]|nr:GAF domain-containing protein [Anaerolineales bacterium]NUQ85032.1 GAF domain-containing protein [Anaerolineales bacterium]
MQTNETRRGIEMNRLPVWLQGWKGFWALVAGAYAAVYSAWILFKWTDPAHEVLIAGLGYLPLGIFAAACSSYVATLKQLNPAIRRAWTFIAVSIISLAVADIVYTTLELTRGVGFPDIPDFLYLAYYPLAFIGLITIPTQVYDLSQKKTWKLDLAIIIASSTAILWYFVLAPTAMAGGDNWVEILVAGAYPAMDILLLSSIASILFRKSEINTRRSLFILGFGLLLYVAADIVYGWLVLQELYLSGAWVDILWTLSYLAVGLAAIRQATPYLTEPESPRKTLSYWQTSLLPFTALGAGVFVSLYASSTGIGAGIRTSGLVIGTALAVFLTITRQIITIRENSRLVDELNVAYDRLRDNASILEERVVERTRELEGQTTRLHLAAQIARDVASARDLESMLDQSTNFILERFKLYHTGIYLLDQKGERLVLAASPTKAGRQMIAEDHRLDINGEGIISRAALTGEPRVLRDHEPDARRDRNHLLPNTRSEMALPLKVENRIIGVLDVHSDLPDAFDENDITVMQILADQLAIAIERTRLLQQTQENLKELQQAYGRSTREGWESLVGSGLLKNAGYRFDNVRIQSIKTAPELGEEAMQSGKPIVRSENGNDSSRQAVAAIPVKLRGQSIGVVTVKLKEGYNPNTITTIEQAVERLAASLESARLFEEARTRADREQAISQVTAAITSAPEFDAILRTTVIEIGRALGDSEVSIQLTE